MNDKIKIGNKTMDIKRAKSFILIYRISATILILFGLLLSFIMLAVGLISVAFGVFLLVYANNLNNKIMSTL